MSNKALILFMYFVAVFLILRKWYEGGGSGMPYPSVIVAPSYLYGVLSLTADFTGGFTTVLAVGLTFGLYQSLKNNPQATNVKIFRAEFPLGPPGARGPTVKTSTGKG